MKKRALLYGLITIYSVLAFAQTPNIAIRRIKVGNTYRETNQYQEAEKNLISGLSLVKQQKDRYWEAVASENLGLLYRDLEDSLKAVRYFDAALGIYEDLNLEGSRLALEQLAESVRKRAQAYAGIDIGSTGVKLSILQVTLGREGHYIYNTTKDSAINANFADLNTTAFEGAKNAIRQYLQIAQNLKITEDRLYIAFSSGVLQEVIRKQLSRDSIRTVFEQVVKSIMPEFNRRIEFLSANDEARFTNIGIVLPKSKERSVSIDIGGGNTKGGYYSFGNFEAFSLPFGSRFLQLSPTDTTLPNNVKLELQTLNQKPGIQNKREVFFLGGIVWAMVNLMYPEKALSDYVEFTYNDVMRFNKMTSENYNNLIDYSTDKVSSITDREILAKAQKNLMDTQNTFTAENLRRGSMLLAGIMNEINIPTIKKRYYFLSKGSHIAWITGYLVNNIAVKYAGASE